MIRRWQVFFVSLLLLCVSVAAEDYPEQPITMVVGFGVGGSADRMARAMSSFVADELGQPVQVINKKGAGTLLASNYVLSRPHNGYTIYASTFSPYMTNTIIEGNAQFTIDDFSYINFQWFDEELIALSKRSKYQSLAEVIEAIRDKPKTVRASVVRGSSGHLMVKLILESLGIPQDNLNLVAYNSGGQARAAVAGGVVDFIVISAKGSESIREYLNPQAIVSDQPSDSWGVLPLNQVLADKGVNIPVLPGSIRGFATSAQFKHDYPERFAKITAAFSNALANKELQELLDRGDIGRRWVGPQRSSAVIKTNFELISKYSYLIQ
ncbi:tripartite tricarboxylate transporter substrate-binding protein [Porticoccaceae bacterium]|nr:tripartite tricarboxylate transporter substrate-binding protein [Porticoccaceae bacterium]